MPATLPVARNEVPWSTVKSGRPPTSSIAENIEINAAAANKGQALLALAAHLGLRPEQTMAFGDGENDVGMLKFAGVGVAMGNASDAVKAQANYVAPGVDDGGIAHTVELFAAKLGL